MRPTCPPDSSFADLNQQICAITRSGLRKLYGRIYPEIPVEFVNFRVRASLPVKRWNCPARKREAAK